MLMNIETGRIDKKEKQPKPKKTAGQKRIIAAHIAAGFFATMVISASPTVIERTKYDTDIKELTDDQNAIYEQFMASEEFSDGFKTEFTKVSNDYANGLIDYEEFDEKVKHLNSVEYAQKVVENSNNTEVKAKIEEIDKQKQERLDKYESNVIKNIGIAGVLTSCVGAISSLIAAMIYTGKEYKIEKRKKQQTKSQCNENCLGTRYYDANNMTIKNTNGSTEENEETLNK